LHYLKRDWLQRKSLKVGEKKCATPSIGRKAQNPATSPTHQTQADENFVKATDRTGSAFKYLAEKFPRLSKMKIKEGVFVGPQIHKLFKDNIINNLLQGDKKKKLGMHFVWCQLTSSEISG
jgi:hypothetical protein